MKRAIAAALVSRVCGLAMRKRTVCSRSASASLPRAMARISPFAS
jgi:hypothetical protein